MNLQNCLCLNDPKICSESKNIFQCTKCKEYFHISCYDTPTIHIINNTILCALCKLEVIEPFWKITYFFQKPVHLPVGPINLNYKISLPSDVLNEIKCQNSKLVIFCMKLKSTFMTNLCYEWPNDRFDIFFNSEKIDYNEYSFAFIENKNSNPDFFKLDNALSVSCDEEINYKCALGICIVQQNELTAIAKTIVKRNKLKLEEAKKKYVELKDSDIESNISVSIKDPMTSYLLFTPTRGINCEHLSCFELMGYLEFNRNNYSKVRWKCPICKYILNTNELVIDLYLHKIIKVQHNNNDY